MQDAPYVLSRSWYLFFVARKKMSKRRDKSIQWCQLHRKNISEMVRKREISLPFYMTQERGTFRKFKFMKGNTLLPVQN